jgi:hypothetical protein
MMEFEQGRYAIVDHWCAELSEAGARIGEKEVPFASAMRSLAKMGTSHWRPMQREFDAALARLRANDDKSYLASLVSGRLQRT